MKQENLTNKEILRLKRFLNSSTLKNLETLYPDTRDMLKLKRNKKIIGNYYPKDPQTGFFYGGLPSNSGNLSNNDREHEITCGD